MDLVSLFVLRYVWEKDAPDILYTNYMLTHYEERYFICCLAEVPTINKWQGYKCVCFYNVLHYFPLKEAFFLCVAQRRRVWL